MSVKFDVLVDGKLIATCWDTHAAAVVAYHAKVPSYAWGQLKPDPQRERAVRVRRGKRQVNVTSEATVENIYCRILVDLT